ncbi:putative glucan endo-1,3-beta-D-glucosidase [Arabidopsis thaliana]|uniref:Carbohydrate-binding X8 domain superfamily protein n=3 Tax=Arabidopsis TaxID=3701 RepID=B3H5T6_ARATH|nr:Carbohydrate-binding X8 domain superfamily protein [Arabidopsis thaliana]AEE34563.1 Carbohydrate-binding X8 domain superfamily protein [Arabidopsis thaliana]KAG7650798.1 X8 domain [Arabidopsis thaliana x Arabidopsis arenosa]OAP15199.1 hypothetical protein AXX17_AT1G60640 [Arabidopsis thaliana]|eukprot:NP_001117561.1 Carbohydrate-binding X8 domain superfamily protein [Arabidopsis thaliana]
MFPQLSLIFLFSLVVIHPFHVSAKTWCVANTSAASTLLQANIDWACSEGKVDCVMINPGGPCFDPDTVISHASFVMNDFYRNHGSTEECNFSGTGQVVTFDPSYGGCVYT